MLVCSIQHVVLLGFLLCFSCCVSLLQGSTITSGASHQFGFPSTCGQGCINSTTTNGVDDHGLVAGISILASFSGICLIAIAYLAYRIVKMRDYKAFCQLLGPEDGELDRESGPPPRPANFSSDTALRQYDVLVSQILVDAFGQLGVSELADFGQRVNRVFHACQEKIDDFVGQLGNTAALQRNYNILLDKNELAREIVQQVAGHHYAHSAELQTIGMELASILLFVKLDTSQPLLEFRNSSAPIPGDRFNSNSHDMLSGRLGETTVTVVVIPPLIQGSHIVKKSIVLCEL